MQVARTSFAAFRAGSEFASWTAHTPSKRQSRSFRSDASKLTWGERRAEPSTVSCLQAFKAMCRTQTCERTEHSLLIRGGGVRPRRLDARSLRAQNANDSRRSRAAFVPTREVGLLGNCMAPRVSMVDFQASGRQGCCLAVQRSGVALIVHRGFPISS